jgi:hypothetical protein
MNVFQRLICLFLFITASCSDRATFETIEPNQGAAFNPTSNDATGKEPITTDTDHVTDPGPIDPEVVTTEPKPPVPPTDPTSEEKNPKPVTEEEVKYNCQTQTVKTLEQKISFPNPGRTCDWKKSGNLSRLNQFVHARREQFEPLNGLGDGIVCGMKFDFPKQDMRYDDEIFLLYNNIVLTSSINYNKFFGEKNGLSSYDWNKIRGIDYDYDAKNPYCLGKDTELGFCAMPYTETSGSIVLNFDNQLIYKISAATDVKLDDAIALPLTTTTPAAPLPGDYTDKARGKGFTFVTTGDNDDSDCQHKDFGFTVTIQYIDKPN